MDRLLVICLNSILWLSYRVDCFIVRCFKHRSNSFICCIHIIFPYKCARCTLAAMFWVLWIFLLIKEYKWCCKGFGAVLNVVEGRKKMKKKMCLEDVITRYFLKSYLPHGTCIILPWEAYKDRISIRKTRHLASFRKIDQAWATKFISWMIKGMIKVCLIGVISWTCLSFKKG